jgi:hypothetical protein
VPPKRPQPQETAPDLPPEKAYSVLSAQLEKLQALKEQDYQQAKAAEDEWYHLTEKLVMRSFGRASPNYRNFVNARSAGEHYMRTDFNFGGYAGIDHGLNQRNLLARLQGYEGALKSSLAELKLDLPDAEIKGVYEPGEEYEFYRDLKSILATAQQEIFVIDPYLNAEIFDVHAGSIPRSVTFRLLSNNVPSDVKALAQKYASGGNLQFRVSGSVHDRVIFVDNRVWISGQSLKDAAKKKPTCIVEHDEPPMRETYERPGSQLRLLSDHALPAPCMYPT